MAKNKNAMHVIVPYRQGFTWVFDDEKYDLVQEPFVAGVPQIIDVMVAEIPNARKGFRLLFSAEKFPGFQLAAKKIMLENEVGSGTWYQMLSPSEVAGMQGWLCPALLNYFNQPPPYLYVKAEPISHDKSPANAG